MNDSKPGNTLANICRACLSARSDTKCLFSLEKIMDQHMQLWEILTFCTSVKISEGDGLPEQICSGCFKQANEAYSFRRLCETSDATLRKENDIGCGFLSGKSPEDNTGLLEYSELNGIGSSDDSLPEYSEEFQSAEVKSEETRDEEDEINGYKEVDDEFKSPIAPENCRTESNRNSFNCNTCLQSFTSKKKLAQHYKLKHKNEKSRTPRVKSSTVCDICNKIFRFQYSMKRHKLIHTGEKRYLCSVCGRAFMQEAYLKIHEISHTGEKSYKCDSCPQAFYSPGTLLAHLRIHTGDCPSVCKICGKSFRHSGTLTVHMRTHTGEKPQRCIVCEKAFNQSSKLNVHMRTHSGEKPYECKLCGMCFTVGSSLNRHMRMHTGERPYICSLCGQAFAHNETLKTHMKMHQRSKEKLEEK